MYEEVQLVMRGDDSRRLQTSLQINGRVLAVPADK